MSFDKVISALYRRDLEQMRQDNPYFETADSLFTSAARPQYRQGAKWYENLLSSAVPALLGGVSRYLGAEDYRGERERLNNAMVEARKLSPEARADYFTTQGLPEYGLAISDQLEEERAKRAWIEDQYKIQSELDPQIALSRDQFAETQKQNAFNQNLSTQELGLRRAEMGQRMALAQQAQAARQAELGQRMALAQQAQEQAAQKKSLLAKLLGGALVQTSKAPQNVSLSGLGGDQLDAHNPPQTAAQDPIDPASLMKMGVLLEDPKLVSLGSSLLEEERNKRKELLGIEENASSKIAQNQSVKNAGWLGTQLEGLDEIRRNMDVSDPMQRSTYSYKLTTLAAKLMGEAFMGDDSVRFLESQGLPGTVQGLLNYAAGEGLSDSQMHALESVLQNEYQGIASAANAEAERVLAPYESRGGKRENMYKSVDPSRIKLGEQIVKAMSPTPSVPQELQSEAGIGQIITGPDGKRYRVRAR